MNQSVTPLGKPERWLPVPGYEGRYEVSDHHGRVRSLSRVRVDRLGRAQLLPERILKPSIIRPGGGRYLAVTLYLNGQSRRTTIHSIVAAAFLGPRPPGQEVCHGPGGSLDNSLPNLSYGTHAKNMNDRRRDGTATAGERVTGAKLNDEIVRRCRSRALTGEPLVALAREFGVTYNAMHHAVSGRTWKHLPAA